MKKLALTLIVAAVFLAAGISVAAENSEKTLDKSASDINAAQGESPQASEMVTGKIKDTFGVTDEQISGLRARNMGYGEITIVFSLAQKMAGGITSDNVNQIMTMRQGPPVMGWGQIAKSLGLKLGEVVSGVKKVKMGIRSEMKHMRQERMMEKKQMRQEKMMEKQMEKREMQPGMGK